jgi:hypothetical protein
MKISNTLIILCVRTLYMNYCNAFKAIIYIFVYLLGANRNFSIK